MTKVTIMTAATRHPYIVCTEDILHGAPIVTVTLAQVFDALSYYQEYREAIDEDIRLNRVPTEKIHPRLQ